MIRYVVAAALAILLGCAAAARDDGQWANSPPSIREWFRSVMVPETMRELGLTAVQSCCGRGDAMRVRMDGEDPVTRDMFVVVEDGNGVMENGTRVRVPKAALQKNYGNPLGVVILFVSGGVPICLIPLEGV